MGNVSYIYVGYATEGQYFQRLAAQLGMTPQQLWNGGWNVFDMMVSFEIPTPGQLTASFQGGLLMNVQYDPVTVTVHQLELSYEGQLAYRWQGTMSDHDFLSDVWHSQTVYGSPYADWFFIDRGGTGYGGDGNDVIELEDNATAYGGAGQDAFDLIGFFAGSNFHIADYQPGEKILFSMFESFEELAAAFQGVSGVTANGFTIHFDMPYGPNFSVTIEGVSLEQFSRSNLQEVVLVGVQGEQELYAPVMQAFGIL